MSQVLTITYAIRLNKYVICALCCASSLNCPRRIGTIITKRTLPKYLFSRIYRSGRYSPPTWNKIIFISKVNRPPTTAAKTTVISLHLTKVADSLAVLVRTPIMTNMDICTAPCRWHLEPGPCPCMAL